MATQYSYDDLFNSPEFEYQVEELRKRLRGEKANYAYLKFRRSMERRLSIVNEF